MARRLALLVLLSLVAFLLDPFSAGARPMEGQAPIAQVTSAPPASPSAPTTTASPTTAGDSSGPTPAGIVVAAVLIGLMLLYRSRVFGRSRPDR